MTQNKTYLCPECFEIFYIQNKNGYLNKYNGKYFDKYSCLCKYKKRMKKMKLLGIGYEKK